MYIFYVIFLLYLFFPHKIFSFIFKSYAILNLQVETCISLSSFANVLIINKNFYRLLSYSLGFCFFFFAILAFLVNWLITKCTSYRVLCSFRNFFNIMFKYSPFIYFSLISAGHMYSVFISENTVLCSSIHQH